MTIQFPTVDEQQQRVLNGTPFVPYCDVACKHFERDYGQDPFCTATTPRTETAWTGKCVCLQRKSVPR